MKRVYRVMKVHGLLLQRHAGGEERRHEGRIAVDARNTRWCSDGLEIGCDNGERVRVAFALDCCDREAMSFVATTSGSTGEDVRDLMVAAVDLVRVGRDHEMRGAAASERLQQLELARGKEEFGLRSSDGDRANGSAVAQHRDSQMLWKFIVLASAPWP